MLTSLVNLLLGLPLFRVGSERLQDGRHDFPTPDSTLLSSKALQWVEDIRVKYDMPGIGIALVAGRTEDDGRTKWETEMLSFGRADSEGRAFTDDLSNRMSFGKPLL